VWQNSIAVEAKRRVGYALLTEDTDNIAMANDMKSSGQATFQVNLRVAAKTVRLKRSE